MIHRRFTRLKRSARKRHLATAAFFITTFVIVFSTVAAIAHPLGNFTINHFTRIQLERDQVGIHYVVDMAEISTFQELQVTDTDGDGKASSAELNAYLEHVTPQYAAGIMLTEDGGSRTPLQTIAKKVTTLPGAGGLPTLRVECDFASAVTTKNSSLAHVLSFEDTNHRERLGWREIVVAPAAGVTVFNSSAFGNAVTDELRSYPQDMLAAPLDERTAQFSWTTGAIPSDAVALRARDGNEVAQSRDQLAELIAVPELTPKVAFLGLLVAAALGALHAFSPGHGKTVVGAYLVGSRGTPRHAAFLGLTVTVTHTLGVFALGFVTLFASQYIVPDRLFPILSFVSGGLVAAIGCNLFVRRLHAACRKARVQDRTHDHTHHAHTHNQADHDHHGHSHMHSHARTHSHLPPGADGTPVTWHNLLALGISGGLLPCPSALVVLLSAIALHRVGYGLLLVVAFSLGLAATLIGIGLAFVYAGSFVKRSRLGAIDNPLVRLLPVVSAFVIMCIGAFICYEAIA